MYIINNDEINAPVVELECTTALRAVARKGLRVRLPPGVPNILSLNFNKVRVHMKKVIAVVIGIISVAFGVFVAIKTIKSKNQKSKSALYHDSDNVFGV